MPGKAVQLKLGQDFAARKALHGDINVCSLVASLATQRNSGKTAQPSFSTFVHLELL